MNANQLVQDCETICLALGPYRNLTTLTASLLFLHPRCQVLNHGGGRIFGTDLDFLADFSKERLDRFLVAAVDMSNGGKRGDFGGSITLSHAFQNSADLQQVYQASGQGLVKPLIKAFFWKESHRITNHLSQHNVSIDALLKGDPRLRFLMPIRNPIDCAMSNLKTGHFQFFGHGVEVPSVETVIEDLFAQYKWFLELEARFPGRMHHLFEHELSEASLVDLAGFLGLDPDRDWLDACTASLKLKQGYPVTEALMRFYSTTVARTFGTQPTVASAFLRFIER